MSSSHIPNPSDVGIDPLPLHRWIADQQQGLIDDLRNYVELETPSDHKASLDIGLQWLRAWLQVRLGEPESRRTWDGGANGDTEVLTFPGEGEPVTLLCHYDTVWPLGTLADIPFSVDGDIARGPGVFDMKAGLVQAVWALRALRNAGITAPPLRLLLNGDEEIGSPASRPVIEETCRGSAAVLVFESSADGAIKSSRKGVGIFDVVVTGIEAHAGLEPTLGASAVDSVARLVTQLHSLTDLTTGTTVNVGLLSGGTRRNVVAGHAHAGIDVRVRSQAEADRIDRELAALRPIDSRVSVTVTGEWNRPPMERTEEVGRLVALARNLAARMGVDLAEVAVGGASDGNFAGGLSLPVLDGLGAVGGGAHARHEHVSISGMVERSALAAAVMAALASR